MEPANEGIGWRQLREFADIDLARSFVLSWNVKADALIVDVDLFLESSHPFYEPPRPAEKVCIRPAVLEFPCCDALSIDRSDSIDVIEIAAEIGHGAISDLNIVGNGRYEICGEFGTVAISAERPILRLKSL